MIKRGELQRGKKEDDNWYTLQPQLDGDHVCGHIQIMISITHKVHTPTKKKKALCIFIFVVRLFMMLSTLPRHLPPPTRKTLPQTHLIPQAHPLSPLLRQRSQSALTLQQPRRRLLIPLLLLILLLQLILPQPQVISIHSPPRFLLQQLPQLPQLPSKQLTTINEYSQ